MAEASGTGIQGARLRQAAVQGMAWAALAVVFLAMERRFEWAAPSALWWGALVFAWSGWRMPPPVGAGLPDQPAPPRPDPPPATTILWVPMGRAPSRWDSSSSRWLTQSSSSIENMTRRHRHDGHGCLGEHEQGLPAEPPEAAKAVASEFVEDRLFDRVGVVVTRASFTRSCRPRTTAWCRMDSRPRNRPRGGRNRHGTRHSREPPPEKGRQEQGGHPHHRWGKRAGPNRRTRPMARLNPPGCTPWASARLDGRSGPAASRWELYLRLGGSQH